PCGVLQPIYFHVRRRHRADHLLYDCPGHFADLKRNIMTNTRPSEADAIQMARYRRLPLPDTAHTRAYVEMMHEVTAFHDALVAADPTQEQSAQMTWALAACGQVVQGRAVDEVGRVCGGGSMGGSRSQALMPAMTRDYVDDAELRARTVAGNCCAGMDSAMPGGVVSGLFGTVMGRLA